jgi:FkbM family methyltransferase
MIRRIKGQARRLVNRLGYEITRLEPRHLHVDAFSDQNLLFRTLERPVVFDVGANIGQTAARYRKSLGKAVLYSFEPGEAAFHQLRGALKSDPQAKVFRVAISDRCGTAQLYLNAATFTNSLLPVAAEAGLHVDPRLIRPVGVADVECTTLDHFCEIHAIPRIHILKLDVQGGELLALRGARRLLAGEAIDLVYCEVSFAALYEGQAHFCDIANLMASHGFQLFGLYDLKHGYAGTLSWGDAIFVGPALQRCIRDAPEKYGLQPPPPGEVDGSCGN